MSEAYKKLVKTLRTLFEMDKADLDFGIYRILNQKRDEIDRFLEHDLLPQVKTAFANYAGGAKSEVQAELDALIKTLTDAGMDPEQSPKVGQLRAQAASAVDITAVENEVYSHLHTFFSRYYDQGDFISQRRYKADTYAIPYEGEEVKLYWANHDQYYVKSSEHLRDYAFTVHDDDGRTVRIKLVEADTEKDNVKAKKEEERRFVLDAKQPLSLDGGELQIRFHYVSAGKKKQDALNSDAVKAIFAQKGFDDWLDLLRTPAPTESNKDRTLLEKHLNDYTARNTFDYFIHKDLGSFLRRELDFYIKNEVLYLDDIDEAEYEVTQAHLRKIKVLRAIAHKIIRLLAQLEDFQKKLWLKKKFVVEANYCITMDRVPTELYGIIADCDAQWAEWIALGLIESKVTLTAANRRTLMEANSYLGVDTRFFDLSFKERLLKSIEDLETQLDGLLVHSENFQAMNLLLPRYREQVKCIYIDPPYNTSSSSIPYKNNYRHSSWGTLMRDRLELLRETLPSTGAIFVSIDKTERRILEYAMDNVFGTDNRVEELIWAMNTNNSQAPNYSTNHEYIEVYARHRPTAEQEKAMFREPKPGFEEVMARVANLNPSYPPVAEIETVVRELYEQHKIEYRAEVEDQGLDFENEKDNDPWRGLFNYNRAEYRDNEGRLVPEDQARDKKAKIWVWREADSSMPATKQADSTRDPDHPNWRFYNPPHPITGKPCPHPKSGWKFAYSDDDDSPDKRSFQSLERDHRISFGEDEKKIPQLKRMLHEVETNVGKSVFRDYSDGEKQTSAMFGKSGVFLAPKHSSFVSRFILHSTKSDSSILDCFGGSGSTAHAVIQLNRSDRGRRKYVLVEMGHHFDNVMKPRVQKAIYAEEWASGKPRKSKTGGFNGVSHCFKYLRLESYEDTLNNLQIRPRSKPQGDLLEDNQVLREDYMLGYWLDVETADSPSLLAVDQFEDPFNYKLNIATGSVGAFKPTAVDLVETFNYLLGLRVKHIDTIRGFKVVTGTNPQDESVLVIWRNVKEEDNAALEAFMNKMAYNPRDTDFARIYVNGDHTLDDPHSKVKMTEIEFKRLMLDVQDV